MMQDKLQEDLKNALRARDELKLTVIRGIKTAITNELVATGKKPTEHLSDEDVLKVITRLSKQRKDSIEQFRAGGREDLVEKEEAELKVLETYLPPQLTDDEIRFIAERIKNEQGMTDTSGIGKLIGTVMKEVAGRAEGGRVKAIVEGLF